MSDVKPKAPVAETIALVGTGAQVGVPETAPLANKADEPVKAKTTEIFVLRPAAIIADDESVIEFRADQAKWKGVYTMVLGKITRANDPKRNACFGDPPRPPIRLQR